MTQFEASAQIAQVLQDYQCQFVEFTDKETSTPPMGVKVKAILSAAFEAEMGGLKNVIELISAFGTGVLYSICLESGLLEESGILIAVVLLFLPQQI